MGIARFGRPLVVAPAPANATTTFEVDDTYFLAVADANPGSVIDPARLGSLMQIDFGATAERWHPRITSSLPMARDTMSQRVASCWKSRMPIAFSPSVRSLPALADSKRLRATSVEVRIPFRIPL